MNICKLSSPNICFSIKSFSTTCQLNKEQLNSAKKFKSSSQHWLVRQLNDKYVKQAKVEHYRCRSAFKLLELQKSFKLLRPGQVVVDLGCAPGSWIQVAVNATKATMPNFQSMVVGVDLSPVHAIEGATLLGGLDMTTEMALHRLQTVLGGRAVDVVLSDMAPTASGHKFMDHDNIIKLCYSALNFAEKTSSHGGSLVMKVFSGSESKKLQMDAKKLYEVVTIAKPDASRKESTEMFYVCLKFKGEKTADKTPDDNTRTVDESKSIADKIR